MEITEDEVDEIAQEEEKLVEIEKVKPEIKEKKLIKPKVKETIEEIKQNQPVVAYLMDKFDAKVIN